MPHCPRRLPTCPPLSDAVADAALDADALGGTRAVDIGWRDFFRDPRLETLIAAALEYNRDLVVAVARIEQARGLLSHSGRRSHPDRSSRAAGVARSHSGAGAAGVPSGQRRHDRPRVDQRRACTRSSSTSGDACAISPRRRAPTTSPRYRRSARSGSRSSRTSPRRISRRSRRRSRSGSPTPRCGAGARECASRRCAHAPASPRRSTSAQAESLLAQAEASLAALRLTQVQMNNQLARARRRAGARVRCPRRCRSRSRLARRSSRRACPRSCCSRGRTCSRRRSDSARRRRASARHAPRSFRRSRSPGAFGFASAALNSLVGSDGMTWSYAGPRCTTPIFNRGRLQRQRRSSRAPRATSRWPTTSARSRSRSAR